MRLTERERDAILACARRHFGAGSRVLLFGSRVDDARRGGDIDLHVVAETPAQATLTSELRFRADLADLIGEERVDVLVREPGYAPRPIDLIALRTGRPL